MDSFEKVKLILIGIGIILLIIVILLVAGGINSIIEIMDNTSDQLLNSIN